MKGDKGIQVGKEGADLLLFTNITWNPKISISNQIPVGTWHF